MELAKHLGIVVSNKCAVQDGCVLGLLVMKSSTELFFTYDRAILHCTDSEYPCLASAMCWSADCGPGACSKFGLCMQTSQAMVETCW